LAFECDCGGGARRARCQATGWSRSRAPTLMAPSSSRSSATTRSRRPRRVLSASLINPSKGRRTSP
jgi:hypothetical protein